MRERDVVDLILVAVLAAVTYVEAFGLADPLAVARTVAEILRSLDVRVYLVLGGIFGIAFVGYLTVYLPRKDAARSAR